MSDDRFDIRWIDAHREPAYAPDPKYPHGVDLDASGGHKEKCKASLPYPAKRCGEYFLRCKKCGVTAIITTAGRPDDPCSVTLRCGDLSDRIHYY